MHLSHCLHISHINDKLKKGLKFYGIIVRMYSEPNSKHNVPHVHVQYQTNEAVYSFDGSILGGSFNGTKSNSSYSLIRLSTFHCI